MVTVAEIAAEAMDAVAAEITDAIHTATLNWSVQGAYDPDAGTYSTTPASDTGRAVEDTTRPIGDVFEDYIVGPGEVLVLLEGFTSVPEENWKLNYGAYTGDAAAEWLALMGGIRKAVIYIITEAMARVTEKSPVDVGTFQNNWLISIGSPSENTTMTLGAFASLNASKIASYATKDGFPIIYIQNNLPYAVAIEYGSSSQAPGGVVAMTVAELEAIWSGMEARL